MSDGESGVSLGRMFDGMNVAQRQRCRDDLQTRSSAVVQEGWYDLRRIWSQGEVVGVALALDDLDELARQCETKSSALNRWAFDLWGLNACEVEVESGCSRTREFFDSLRAVVRGAVRHANPISESDIEAYAQKVYKANREAGY